MVATTALSRLRMVIVATVRVPMLAMLAYICRLVGATPKREAYALLLRLRGRRRQRLDHQGRRGLRQSEHAKDFRQRRGGDGRVAFGGWMDGAAVDRAHHAPGGVVDVGRL